MLCMIYLCCLILMQQALGRPASRPVCDVVVHPAPPGAPTTTQWTVRVNGQSVPVFHAMVFHGGPAFFCRFDTDGAAHIEARPAWDVRHAVVRPLAKGITPSVDHHTIAFEITGPCQLSVEPNGLINHPLFIFADPPETDAPEPGQPGLRFYGPGFHTVSRGELLESGQQIYIAGGAWVQAVMPDDPKQAVGADREGMPMYQPLFRAHGAKKISIRGRGIIDMSRCDWHSRTFATLVGCRDVCIGGITVLDGPRWTVVVAQSDAVRIQDVKLIGHRSSNDGIDLLNSRDVTVRRCFTRVGDDGIVVKTFPGGGPAHDILVEDCVVWNDKVRGIGITAETAEPISRIRFRDIDIIHDLTTSFDMAWTMSIYMEDCGPITDVRFEDIRCEDTREKLIQIAVTKGRWATTDKLGPIEGVLFKNLRYTGSNKPRSVIRGHDDVNHVKGVRFEDFTMNGNLIDSAPAGNIEVNDHAYDVTFTGKPASRSTRP